MMASITRTLLPMLAALVVAACSSGRRQNDEPSADSSPSAMATPAGATTTAPAEARAGSYTGIIPCADCEGIRYTLVLEPDSTYYLRMLYMGRDNSNNHDELGRWSLSPDAERVILQGPGSSTMLAIHGDTLRLLGADGRPNDTKLNFDIVRATSPAPIEPKLLLHGMYRYMADAGTFTECATGMMLPVAAEGDNAALQAAYTKERTAPGADMLVTVEGHIAVRPRADGSGQGKVLVVDRFSGAVPNGVCGDAKSTASLENTYWRLVMIGDTPVKMVAGRREAQMTLSSADTTVKGFSGCNGFSGPYTLNGRSLKFGGILSTKMACVEGMEVETGFFTALNTTASYAITGKRLELLDADGGALARFEAVAPR